jgi:hypothetical protein
MKKHLFTQSSLFALALFLNSGCGRVAANSASPLDPPQATQQTLAHQLKQVFTLTTSNEATYSNPSGALEPMPGTSLNFQTVAPGILTISFSARGTVQPSGSQIIPIVFIECHVDGQACQPDSNTVEFLYPQFCCDTRSFRWVAQGVPAGSHTVEILWGMGNPTSAVATNRSLIVETATP